MKLPRISVATLGFAVFVMAVDFALLRAAFTGGPNKSAFFVILLIPMLDVLLIRGFKLCRPGRRSAASIGFLVGGSLAFAAITFSCLTAPEIVLSGMRQIVMPFLAKFAVWAPRLLGNRVVQSMPGTIVIAIGFEVILPAMMLSLPPLAVAHACRWVGRRSDRARPLDIAEGEVMPFDGGSVGLAPV